MSSPVRYFVRRQEYTPPTAAGVRRVLPERWTAVATFAKPADAHAECAKLLADARRTLNPFQLGGPNLFYQTSLPAYALHDYLLDHDLTPPPTATSSNPNYVFWWVKNNRTFTDEQRAVVWTACDKLKLFEVVEEDDRQAAWLVVETNWHNSQLAFTRGELVEGGFIRSAHRAQRDGNRALRDFRSNLRDEYEEPPEPEMEEHCVELVSVPLADESGGELGCFVCRQSFDSESGGYVWGDLWFNAGCRIPLAAFGTVAAARDTLSERSAAARRTVNPFTLVLSQSIAENLLGEDETELPNGLSIEDAYAAVRRLDTTPPPPESNDLLADWYDQVVQWSPEYIDVIWGTFADFRLFEVIEVPFG